MNPTFKFNNRIKALAVCIGFFSLAACKESSISKSTLIPPVDNINTFEITTDSFDISFSSAADDSVLTSNKSIIDSFGNSNLAIGLGTYTDPFFGKTTASAYFQVVPYAANFKFPDNTVIDSAVLVLPYTNKAGSGKSYGDTMSSLNLKVYRTTETVDFSKSYFNTRTLAIDNAPIGTASIPFGAYSKNSQQVIAATNDTTTGQLRIKLSNNFASEIKNLDTTTLSSSTAFFEYLKGIYITPDPILSGNIMSYFLAYTNSSATINQKSLDFLRLELHYHNAQDSAMMASFPLKPGVCGNFTNIKRDYTGSPAMTFINRTSDSILIEGRPGFHTDITINNLDKIPLSVINKAQLEITVASYGNDAFFTSLDVIAPTILNDDGSESELFELLDNAGNVSGSGSSFVNPYPQKIAIGGMTYTKYLINIPRSLQNIIIQGKNKIRIRLKASTNFLGMNRILAQGVTGAADTKFQFNVIYTKK